MAAGVSHPEWLDLADQRHGRHRCEGYGGFDDEVDNHCVQVVGSAILIAAINAGINISMPASPPYGYQQTPTDAARNSFAESFGRVAEQTINVAHQAGVLPDYFPRRDLSVQTEPPKPIVELRSADPERACGSRDVAAGPRQSRLIRGTFNIRKGRARIG